MTQNFTPYLSDRSLPATSQAPAQASAAPRPMGSLASRASNAANGAVPLLKLGNAIELKGVDFVPHASQAGSATNYADVTIIDMGTDGTGTAVLGTKSFSAVAASVAALVAGPMTMVTSKSSNVASGHIIGVSYTSQGNGIALVAHGINLDYRQR